jgi:hypothetical protein
MQSIDERSATDFKSSGPIRPGTKSQARGTSASFLGLFLDQKAIMDARTREEEEEEDDDESLGIGSRGQSSRTSGKPIFSTKSKAEQSTGAKTLDDVISEDTCTEEKKAGSARSEDLTPADEEENLHSSLNLEDIGPVVKQLRFRDEDSERYISQELTDSMYYDLFWTSEELADFRYAAFLEEAGLDVNEYM